MSVWYGVSTGGKIYRNQQPRIEKKHVEPKQERQIVMDGDMQFKTAGEAARAIGCTIEKVEEHLAGITNTCRGHVLAYVDDPPKKPRSIRPVMMDGEVWFPHIKAAADYLGCSPTSVRNALIGETKTCQGHVFTYADEWVTERYE